MNERTEEQKLAQDAIVVILGGKEYDIKPLVIRESREWRKKVINLIAPLLKMSGVTMDTPDDFADALTQMTVTMPDQVVGLFFDYSKLDRDEIEGIATDAELAKAFEEVLKIAFPLAESAPKAMMRLFPSGQPSNG